MCYAIDPAAVGGQPTHRLSAPPEDLVEQQRQQRLLQGALNGGNTSPDGPPLPEPPSSSGDHWSDGLHP